MVPSPSVLSPCAGRVLRAGLVLPPLDGGILSTLFWAIAMTGCVSQWYFACSCSFVGECAPPPPLVFPAARCSIRLNTPAGFPSQTRGSCRVTG